MTRFAYAPQIARMFPSLVTALAVFEGPAAAAHIAPTVARLERQARDRLAWGSEAEIPAIRAWRAAFAAMGLKPTQYRCAAEALLRRLRKTGALPRVSALVDLGNAVSAAYAVPVASFDLDRISGALTVGPATGRESYLTFGGEIEHPAPGEIIFADGAATAHARRWTNRQSATSAVSPHTRRALVVIEALHPGAEVDVTDALEAVTGTVAQPGTTLRSALLSGGRGGFDTGRAA